MHPEFLYHPVYRAVSEILGDHESGQFLQFLPCLLGIDACTEIKIHRWQRLVVLLVGIVAAVPGVACLLPARKDLTLPSDGKGVWDTYIQAVNTMLRNFLVVMFTGL